MIYIIYECDAHRSYSSFCIKEICTSKTTAIAFYKEGKKRYYQKGDGYFLNLAEYEPRFNLSFDNSVLADMNIIMTSENE